jgi:hypothetical protein
VYAVRLDYCYGFSATETVSVVEFQLYFAVQAQADDMGMIRANGNAQRDSVNEASVDLRTVTNSHRQLPYHIARQCGHR